MTSAYWTFGKVLLAYTVVEFSFGTGEFIRLQGTYDAPCITVGSLLHRPPLMLFLLPAACLLAFHRQPPYLLILILGGLSFFWASKNAYQFIVSHPDVTQSEEVFRFWLGENGLRSLLRWGAAMLIVNHSGQGLCRLLMTSFRNADAEKQGRKPCHVQNTTSSKV